MRFGFLTKLFHFDSSGDGEPQLDVGKLYEVKKGWQVDIVEGGTDDPLVSAKEKGVEIISEELSKRHGRTNPSTRSGRGGGAWRSTTKGRGK